MTFDYVCRMGTLALPAGVGQECPTYKFKVKEHPIGSETTSQLTQNPSQRMNLGKSVCGQFTPYASGLYWPLIGKIELHPLICQTRTGASW